MRFSTLNYSHSPLLIDSLLCRISVSHLRFWQILALSSMTAHNLLRMRLWIQLLRVLISVWGVRIIALISGVKISLRRYHHRWMNHLAVRSAHLNDIHLVSILASICWPFRANDSSLCVDLLRGKLFDGLIIGPVHSSLVGSFVHLFALFRRTIVGRLEVDIGQSGLLVGSQTGIHVAFICVISRQHVLGMLRLHINKSLVRFKLVQRCICVWLSLTPSWWNQIMGSFTTNARYDAHLLVLLSLPNSTL